MTSPTHIRFTQDEDDAIEAYAALHGLKKASAVRKLLELGLAVADGKSELAGRRIERRIDALQAEIAQLRADLAQAGHVAQAVRPPT